MLKSGSAVGLKKRIFRPNGCLPESIKPPVIYGLFQEIKVAAATSLNGVAPKRFIPHECGGFQDQHPQAQSPDPGARIKSRRASDAQLDRYRAIGLRPILIGEEAVLRPDEFSLEGRPIRKVRQSVTRLTKAGYTLRVVAAEDADPALREALDDVSEAWRGNQPERGFTMAIDELHVPGTVFAVAEDEHGAIGGFLHLAPTPAGGGWSLSTMRRRPDTPNGLTEFLIAETLAWAKESGASEISLNFCAFTELISPERAVTPLRRVARRALLAADSVFQLERLYAFNRKFFPEWRPRYLCVERLTDLPRVGLAYLHVEQLLVPPGPWTKRSRSERQVVSH